jgi:hypothetical protein
MKIYPCLFPASEKYPGRQDPDGSGLNLFRNFTDDFFWKNWFLAITYQ